MLWEKNTQLEHNTVQLYFKRVGQMFIFLPLKPINVKIFDFDWACIVHYIPLLIFGKNRIL